MLLEYNQLRSNSSLKLWRKKEIHLWYTCI